MQYVFGIDLGGTAVKLGLFATDGKLLAGTHGAGGRQERLPGRFLPLQKNDKKTLQNMLTSKLGRDIMEMCKENLACEEAIA